MTKSKFSASFIFVPSIVKIHLHLHLKATCVSKAAITVVSPFTKI